MLISSKKVTCVEWKKKGERKEPTLSPHPTPFSPYPFDAWYYSLIKLNFPGGGGGGGGGGVLPYGPEKFSRIKGVAV